MPRWLLPVAIFAFTIVGLLLCGLVPTWVPVRAFPLGQVLYRLDWWIIGRSSAAGAGVQSQEACRMIFSGLAFVAALFVILNKTYRPPERHWAFGTVGMILGYWLKT